MAPGEMADLIETESGKPEIGRHPFDAEGR
jgi:hypothetical protein